MDKKIFSGLENMGFDNIKILKSIIKKLKL